MLALLALHLVAAVVAPLLVRWIGKRAFYVLAVPSVLTVAWALSLTSVATQADGVPVEIAQWAPSIGLNLSFSLDTLAWLMCLIVGGIGALVLVYCVGYFDDDEPGLGIFAGFLTGFAGAMYALVISNNLLVLYVFWEITTVLSYLLVGHKAKLRESREAASQALVVTTLGGLAMLIGFVVIGQLAGTFTINQIIADPPQGTLAATAVVLVLVGAITKSALVPFHFWLPGAMAAPTPVSAYLHAAAMVKAGIYLVARFAPGFSDAPTWLPTILVLGGFTMLLGGYRSLRQHDLKLVLAYGTVSQLGFLTILVGTGTREAALAGLTMLVAHALFKAGLFLTVGAIDHATGTRDLREISGLRKKMPVLFVASVLCAASMSGVPPMLGFVGKEAVYATYEHGASFGLLSNHTLSNIVLGVVILGSVFTFAYSARFLWGAWKTLPDKPDTPAHHLHPVMIAVPAVLGLTSLVLAPISEAGEPLLAAYTEQWEKGPYPVHLGLWHGFNLTLVLSLLTLATGALLFALKNRIERAQAAAPHAPSAVLIYRWIMQLLDRVSLEVTGFVQRGSLPLTLGLILVIMIVLPGGSLLFGTGIPEFKIAESWAQAGVVVLTILASILAVRSRGRIRAVFLVGITGYGCAMIFLLHGAPDLALTQVLVETVSVVFFVLVLRRYPEKFEETRGRVTLGIRIGLGVLSGAVVAALAMVASGARTAVPTSYDLAEGALKFGGGSNVVNVILVDARAWDTMGEISVVLVAATGIASLVFLDQRKIDAAQGGIGTMRKRRREHNGSVPDRGGWLAEAGEVQNSRRSFLFEVVVRLTFHTVMILSLYLLFAGHNLPGGGFVAGLVAGLALTVRYLAGGRNELRAALPLMPGILFGSGLFIAVGTGVASMLAGGAVLQSYIFDFHVPLLGEVHLVTSLFFDIGVYLVVIGLMLDILRSLGAGVDADIEEQQGDDPSTVAIVSDDPDANDGRDDANATLPSNGGER